MKTRYFHLSMLLALFVAGFFAQEARACCPTSSQIISGSELTDPHSVAFNSNTNCLAVANGSGNTVIVYPSTLDADCTYNTTIFQTLGASEGILSPLSVAFNSNTNCLAVANDAGPSVTIYSLSGDCIYTLAQTLTNGVVDPQSIAFNTSTNCLAVANYSSNTVTIYSQSGDCTYTLAQTLSASDGIFSPSAVAFNATTNCLAVANTNGNTVTLYSQSGDCTYTLAQTLSAGIVSPYSVSFNPNANCLAVANFYTAGTDGTGTVTIYSSNSDCTYNTSNYQTISDSINNPASVAFNSVANCLAVANKSNGAITIYAQITDTDCTYAPTETVYGYPVSVAFNSATNCLAVANTNSTVAVYALTSALSITSQPTPSTTLCIGSAYDLAVTASGIGLSYQWYFNNTVIPGATNSSYTIASVADADAGTYYVVVTGTCGATQSDNAVLIIGSVSSQVTASQTQINAGQSVTLTATALGGTAPYSYIWSDGFVTTNAVRTVTPSISTSYSVTVIDANGCTSDPSVAVTITVNSIVANLSELALAILAKYC